jgi:L-fucose mutarotase/ribose pyranase (RbsD/FucU family)
MSGVEIVADRTGERRFYGCFLFRFGVVPPSE